MVSRKMLTDTVTSAQSTKTKPIQIDGKKKLVSLSFDCTTIVDMSISSFLFLFFSIHLQNKLS